MSTVRLSFIDTDIELAKSDLSIGNRVSKKNIHLISLRYSGSYDFFAGWEIQTIIKSKTGFYDYLFTENRFGTIEDLASYRRFLFIRKISKMKELVPLVTNHDSSEWLKSIIEEAEKVFIKKSDIAIKYINGHAQDIFGDQQSDIELKYASLDFIIERLTGIDHALFEYIRRNCDCLTAKRIYDQLLKFFLGRDTENEKPLFRVIFPSGHMDAVNQLGLHAVLDIWGHEYSKEDSPFRTDIDRYAAELCQDAESLCKNMSAETVLNTEPAVKSVSLFLQSIRSPKANEFSEYLKKAEDLKRQYFSDRQSSVKCSFTVHDIEHWKSIGNSDSKLLALTHKINEGSGKYKSYLDEEIQSSPLADNCADIPSDNFFTAGRQQYLSVLEVVQSSVFADILNDPAAFECYSQLLKSAVRSVFRKMSLPDDYLEDDLSMLLSMLGLVSRNIDIPGQELEVLCYGPSVFLCSFMEKLLFLFYRHLAKSRTYVPAEMTFSDLLRIDNNDKNYLLKAFGCTYIRCLAYFLSKTPDTRIGRNYRNSLAHWDSGMRPEDMTSRLTSCFLWLFTDVLNSVSLYVGCHPNESVPGEVAGDK